MGSKSDKNFQLQKKRAIRAISGANSKYHTLIVNIFLGSQIFLSGVQIFSGGLRNFWGVEKFSGGGLSNFLGVEKFSGGGRNFRGGLRKFFGGGVEKFFWGGS